jgi:hypothetical protein
MDYRVKQSTKIIKIGPIRNEEAAELFFNLNAKNQGFKKIDGKLLYNEIELKKLSIFNKELPEDSTVEMDRSSELTPKQVQLLSQYFQKMEDKSFEKLEQKMNSLTRDGIQSLLYEQV